VEDFSMMKTQKVLLMVGTAFAMAPIMVACASIDGSDVCTTSAECGDGEFCNNPNGGVDGGLCVAEGGEGEGEGEATPTCPGGDIDDGACLEDRADGVDPQLCDGTNCVPAGELTANCTGAEGHTDDGGPVVFDVALSSDDNVGDGCDPYSIFSASVYSEEPFETSLNSQRLKYLNAAGTVSGTYSEVDVLPTVTEIGGGYYLLSFNLCGSGDNGAIFLSNDADVDGNAACIP
jgi:hypothetical protein